MKFETSEHADTKTRTFTLTIEEVDVMSVHLFDFDRAVMTECEASGSIADKLLGLELLARRVEESDVRMRAQRLLTGFSDPTATLSGTRSLVLRD